MSPFLLTFNVVLLWLLNLLVVTTLSPGDRRRVDDVIESKLTCHDIPGISVSIVGGGKILLERGYGSSSAQPVTADTLFPLGSVTKAFTTALLALLIEKHRERETAFNWTTPVRNIFGESFALYNQQLTSQTTLEDILSHRTGIPDYFLLLVAGYPYNVTRRELIKSLRYHKPQFDFRADYLYNNHMYVLGGHVAEVVEGRSYEDLVDSYLLEPLGMTSTQFVRDALKTSRTKLALSCSWTNGTCHPVELQLLDQVDVAAPAGAIVSSARDMSRWMLWHLSGGKPLIDKNKLWDTYRGRNFHFARYMTARDDQRSAQASSLTSSATEDVVEQSTGTQRPTDNHLSYDLGWMTSTYRGVRRVWHSGSISTYKTQVWLFPDNGYGLFVTVAGPNRPDTTTALIDLLHDLSDIILFQPQQPSGTASPPASASLLVTDSPNTSSSAAAVDSRCHDIDLSARAMVQEASSSRDHDSDYPLPVDSQSFVGHYYSEEYITNMTVTEIDGRLRLSVGRLLTAQLRHHAATDQHKLHQFDAIVDGRLWWFADPTSGLPIRFLMASSSAGDATVAEAVELQLYLASSMNDTDWARFARVKSSAGVISLPPCCDVMMAVIMYSVVAVACGFMGNN